MVMPQFPNQGEILPLNQSQAGWKSQTYFVWSHSAGTISLILDEISQEISLM